MSQRDLEDVLRQPAPDEPSTLRPLELPDVVVERVSARRGFSPRLGRVAGLAVVLAVATLVAVGALIQVGTTRPAISTASPVASSGSAEPPSSASTPASTPASTATPGPSLQSPADLGPTQAFTFGSVAFEAPRGWFAAGSETRQRYSSAVASIAGFDIVARCPDPANPGSLDLACVQSLVLEPDQALVTITAGSPAFVVDVEPPQDQVTTVGGFPAVSSSGVPVGRSGADERRRWHVTTSSTGSWVEIDALLRGPALGPLRAQVEAIVGSITFPAIEMLPTGLAGEQALAAVTRAVIDGLDRDSRNESRSMMYACFPREPNASRNAVVADAPHRHLPGPVPVVCSVEGKPNSFQEWEITLTVAWDAGPGYAAGAYSERVTVGADGRQRRLRALTPQDEFPATAPEPSGTVSAVRALPPGSFVQVLAPGVTVFATPDAGGNALSDAGPQEPLYIVSGPRLIAGTPWYRVQWQPTASFDGIPGWIPAVVDGRATIGPAEPCPARGAGWDVPGLVAMHPAARLACVDTHPWTLGPVMLEKGSNVVVGGTPAWLATQSTIRMFGSGGPDGLDGSIWVVKDPALAELALGTWLEVTGHFDDPAAAACVRTTPEGSDTVPETAAEAVLHCREQFVITSVTPAEAPPGATPAP